MLAHTPDLFSVRLPEASIEKVALDWLECVNSELFVLRLDDVHPTATGNKWFKLLFNLTSSLNSGDQVLTFGGAFSNHLASFVTSALSRNLRPICVIRGEELSVDSNLLLSSLAQLGAELIFISRENYKHKYSQSMLKMYREQVGDFLLIPEGGANIQGDLGCCLVAKYVLASEFVFSDLYLASGTGATSAGLIAGLEYFSSFSGDSFKRPLVHSVSMFKGGWMEDEIDAKVSQLRECLVLPPHASGVVSKVSYRVETLSHQARYGQLTSSLFDFICNTFDASGLLLDPVYTAKVLLHIKQQAEHGLINNKKVLFVHTGGISGWLGYPQYWLEDQEGGDKPFQLSGTIKNRLSQAGLFSPDVRVSSKAR